MKLGTDVQLHSSKRGQIRRVGLGLVGGKHGFREKHWTLVDKDLKVNALV